MMFEKENSAGCLANLMAHLFARGPQEWITSLRIVTGQFPMLLESWEHGGVTWRKFLFRLDVEQATLANTLTRMERDGPIIQTRHPTDARVQQIWLTSQAKPARDQAYKATMAQNALALSDLSEEKQVQFVSYMRRVIAAMRDGHNR